MLVNTSFIKVNNSMSKPNQVVNHLKKHSVIIIFNLITMHHIKI